MVPGRARTSPSGRTEGPAAAPIVTMASMARRAAAVFAVRSPPEQMLTAGRWADPLSGPATAGPAGAGPGPDRLPLSRPVATPGVAGRAASPCFRGPARLLTGIQRAWPRRGRKAVWALSRASGGVLDRPRAAHWGLRRAAARRAFTSLLHEPGKQARRSSSGLWPAGFVVGAGFEPATSGL